MKPDSMIVDFDHIVSARKDVSAKGSAGALNEFAEAEPALGSFIYESLAAAAGKLALSGAPNEVVQGAHEEVLDVILTCVQALRRGHYELWKDTVIGTRLAQFDTTLRPAKKRRRKKADAGEHHEESSENGGSGDRTSAD
jgi:hypothetical protein